MAGKSEEKCSREETVNNLTDLLGPRNMRTFPTPFQVSRNNLQREVRADSECFI